MLTGWAFALLLIIAYQLGGHMADRQYVMERQQMQSTLQTIQVALWRAQDATRQVDSVMAMLGSVKDSTQQSRITP